MAVVECFSAYSEWQNVVIVQARTIVQGMAPNREYWVSLFALQLHQGLVRGETVINRTTAPVYYGS